MISLYGQLKKLDMVEKLLHELKKNNVEVGSLTVNNVLRVYARINKIKAMEKFKTSVYKEEIELERDTIVAMANAYHRAGSIEKAIEVHGDKAGSKTEVYHLWNSYKKEGKLKDDGYRSVISSLLKLDDVQGAENIYKEWTPKGPKLDISIPGLLISQFCAEGKASKVEELIRKKRNGMYLKMAQNLSTPRYFALPRALQNGPSQAIDSNEELIGEIAELDTEILLLERYLLSLYRSSFGDHLPASLLLDNSPLPPSKTKFHNDRASSVSDMSVLSSFKSLSEMDKIKRSDSGHPSLADLLGLNTLSPNKLSEEILRSICVVHYKLSDKQGHSRIVKKNSKNENINEELGVVIGKLCLEDDNLKSVESLLQNFRSLVQKLEKVDPERMAREEKLAFWINIHNALVMHAYIVYGFSEDTTSTTILKAAFNIGGERINAYDVQSSILGIHACHSPSRLWTLFSPARSSKTSSGRHTYSLDYAEPLLHFALSTGASTDPMVRVYTAEGIFQELRQARDRFIQTSVRFEKETKILLPKIIYNYAKDTSLNMVELFNTISECLTETQRTTLTRVVKKKQDRYIRWINHDSNFRYIIHPELMRESFYI
ncbi:unnamed protein product [Arabidopsis arenosa]|uniref:DUF547 domain-containing protein n=1 Tax=Arabidopsis arenosa TaxID=38785 RepID=A0A8S1ZHS5_ARAAE|nr:unnamed protein product [Arabidopsis arenosa]